MRHFMSGPYAKVPTFSFIYLGESWHFMTLRYSIDEHRLLFTLTIAFLSRIDIYLLPRLASISTITALQSFLIAISIFPRRMEYQKGHSE